MTNTTIQPGQEKIASTLSYLFFLIPTLMKVKTEYTMFHARQAFFLNCIFILAFIIGLIPFIGWLRWPIYLILLVVGGWSAYQAYLGNRFIIPGIAEYTNKIITTLNIAHIFKI